jgi:general secretion pathway protein K
VNASAVRGSALIAVLWVLLLLAALVAIVTATSRTEIERTRGLAQSAHTRARLESALAQVLVDLATPDLTRQGALGGSARTIQLEGSPIQVTVSEETENLNLNTADAARLASYFAARGSVATQAASLAARITDWRDRDDEERAGGAEALSYSRAHRSYGPRNAPFETLSELTQVLGFDRASVARYASGLTVYGSSVLSEPSPAATATAAPLPDAQTPPATRTPPASGPLEGRILTLIATDNSSVAAGTQCLETVRMTGNAAQPALVLRLECEGIR